MKRDHQLFVKDIIAAIEAIEQFVEGLSLSEFKNWDPIQLELPELKPRLKKILSELQK